MPFTTAIAAGVRLVLVGASIVACAAPASAQIFTWRDLDGSLVVSDRPRPEAGVPLAVSAQNGPRRDAVRATRPVPTSRSRAYDQLIQEHARLNGIRPALVRAVIQVESGFNPTAVSPKGAMGLMQLMPATAADFGVGNPFEPSENVRAGVAYLRRLLDRYHDDEELALAAYNAGPAAVDRHGQSVPPFRETRNYVFKVNEAAGPLATRVPGTRIYKTIEFIDGRPVVRYSDTPTR